MNAITIWSMAFLLWKAPPEKMANQYQLPGYEETADQKTQRYQSIAEDVVAVAFDPAERPLYGGPNGRAKTVVTLLSVAFHESGFAKDVDIGPCYRGKNGKDQRCDGGASSCVLQIKIGAGTTTEGWTQADLFADRKKCFKAGKRLLARSFKACSRLGPDHLFDAFASGVCGLGNKRARELASLVSTFHGHAKPPGPDSEFLQELVAVQEEPKSSFVSYLERRLFIK
jgi:hypothetical protein